MVPSCFAKDKSSKDHSGCRCTFTYNVFTELVACEENTLDHCTTVTVNDGECVPFPGDVWSSMYVDCLAQVYLAFNSSDCSGPMGSAAVAGQCSIRAFPQPPSITLVKWNKDCNGQSAPVKNKQECEPVLEPDEDEACFVSTKVSTDCSLESANASSCFYEGWFNHTVCKPVEGGSFKMDCINKIGFMFPALDCTGPGFPFANDMCSPVQDGLALNAKWGQTCDGEPREVSKDESESSDQSDSMEDSDDTEDGEEESSQNDGSESEGDGSSSASSLRFDLLC
ncbi:dentin sialophosphoprotein [Balamuthia mandrillaris]